MPGWARNGWIDYVAVSEFLFERGDLPIGQWRQAIPAIPVYGGIECTKGSGQQNLSADEYRRAAAQLLKQGADGIYLFNFFTSREGGEGRLRAAIPGTGRNGRGDRTKAINMIPPFQTLTRGRFLSVAALLCGAALAIAGVPLLAIHGDSDNVVPSQAKRTKPKPPQTVQLGGAWGAALARGVERLAREPYTSEEWLLADITDKIRRYPNNYSGDVPGRYIELAVLTSAGQPFSPPLVSNVLAALPGLQKPDGHFGVDLDLAKPTDATSPLYPMLWGNGRLLIGLPVAARATGDPRLWEAARRLGDFYVNSAAQLCSPAREAEFRATGTYGVGYTCCYFPAIEGLALLYQDTGEERYLRQAERMAEVFNKFDALPIDHSHGNLCAWRGILALYEITGKRAYLLGAQAKWEQAMQGGYVWPLGGIGEHFYKDYSR